MGKNEGTAAFFDALSEAVSGVRRDEPLVRHSSYHIGGPADFFVTVGEVADLAQAVRLAATHGVPYVLLGGGSNVLVSERGVRGLVVHNRCRGYTILTEDDESGPSVLAESGMLMPHLAQATAAAGLAGLEWAVGVPGSVGGSVLGNAGAWGGSVSERLRYAEVLRPDGTTAVLGPDEMAYRYRGSRLKRAPGEVIAQAGEVVLRASFALHPGDPAVLLERIAQFRRERLERQPQQASAGSVFKNPPGDHAGRLIEAAGLKGTRRGQAQISEKHANFIVNLGGATAPDVLALINLARERVKETAGLELELEVQLVGEW